MPWHIEEIEGDYCVVKDSDGEIEGCHADADDAEAQMAALYASEAERVGVGDWLRKQLQPLGSLISVFTRRAWSGDASNYSGTDEYCEACLIDVNSAAGREEKAQSHCMLPIEPAGSDSVDWEGVQAAAGGHGIQAVEKPEDVPEDAWDSALTAAANRIIEIYNEHDETAPDAVYEIAGKEAPERAISLSLAYDQLYDQMWESEDLSSAWIHDIYFGHGGDPFLVVSQRGKLYRVNMTVAGDSVSLGEMEPVEIRFEPTERLATKTVIREVSPGVFRWFSISATSVLNKDGEIDSQALFDSFVDHVERTSEYPVRRFHHIQHDKFITGTCDFVARDEHVLVTSGLYNDSLLAELEIKARRQDPDDWGESIGYLPTDEPEMLRVSGVEIPTYNEGVLREISTVSSDNACSWFTTTVLREEETMSLNARARETLVKLFDGDEEAMEEFVGELTLTNREIEAEGLISREDSNDDEPESDPVDREPQEVILDEEAMDAIVDRFSAVVEPLRERIDALEGAIATAQQDREQNSEEIAGALTTLTERVERLEIDEEEKVQQRLEDTSPKMRRTRVKYRPRVERDEEEEEDASEYEAKAKETLSVIPA